MLHISATRRRLSREVPDSRHSPQFFIYACERLIVIARSAAGGLREVLRFHLELLSLPSRIDTTRNVVDGHPTVDENTLNGFCDLSTLVADARYQFDQIRRDQGDLLSFLRCGSTNNQTAVTSFVPEVGRTISHQLVERGRGLTKDRGIDLHN